MDDKLGTIIKGIRKSKGITGKWISAKIGVAPSTLSKYESNTRKIPSDLLPKLAIILGVEVDYFFKQNIGNTPIKEPTRLK